MRGVRRSALAATTKGLGEFTEKRMSRLAEFPEVFHSGLMQYK